MKNLTKETWKTIAAESDYFREILVDSYLNRSEEPAACYNPLGIDIEKKEEELISYLRCFYNPFQVKISMIKLTRQFAQKNNLRHLMSLAEAKAFVEKYVHFGG